MGPGGGVHGGRVVASGTPEEVMRAPESLTGQYLSGFRQIPVPTQRRKARKGRFLTLKGATGNNLKNVDVSIPLGTFTCVTGVSGGGKSTLVIETLWKARSEEHTSELQSLMRISYAVFCLKKKTEKNNTNT